MGPGLFSMKFKEEKLVSLIRCWRYIIGHIKMDISGHSESNDLEAFAEGHTDLGQVFALPLNTLHNEQSLFDEDIKKWIEATLVGVCEIKIDISSSFLTVNTPKHKRFVAMSTLAVHAVRRLNGYTSRFEKLSAEVARESNVAAEHVNHLKRMGVGL